MSNQSEDQRVPVGQKVAWGLGGFSENLSNNALLSLAYPIFEVGLKLNPMLIGIALSVSRVLDAITDPLMGNVSDNTKSRWGRRRPWIFLGAIVMSLFFAAIWLAPSNLSESGLFAWLAVTSILFYLGFTIFIIPYSGLGLEMAVDYGERTRLQIYRLVPAFVAGLVTPWMYKLALLDVFESGAIPREVVGIRYVGPATAVLILICAVAPALYTRERYPSPRSQPIRLVPALRLTLSDGPYLRVVGAAFAVFIGLYFVFPLMTYVGIYHVCEGDKELYATITGWSGSVVAVAQFLVMPLLSWLSGFVEKKTLQIGGLLIAIVGYLSSLALFTPETPWLMAVPPIISNLGLCACWVVNGSFVADICDRDELRCGHRREGMYSAVFGFVYKSAIGIVALFSSGLLTWAGVDSSTETVVTESLDRLRYAYALVPAAFLGAAVLLMWRYPLSRARVAEIQEQLERKHDETDVQDSADDDSN